MRKRYLLLLVTAFFGVAFLAVDRYTRDITGQTTEQAVREPDYYGEVLFSRRYEKDGSLADTFYAAKSEHFPEGDLTVNAYYWLGEVYLAKPQLEQARQAFTIVATRYSDHRKAPDAVYKLGVTLDRLGEKDEARRRMSSVVEQYPDSGAAELAQKYLDSAQG